MGSIYLAVIIILVLFLITLGAVNHYKQNAHVDEYLQGLWVADEKFCQDSDIDGMMVYIGPQIENERRAYLIMHRDNVIIVEKKLTMQLVNYAPRFWFHPTVTYSLSMNDADVSDLSEDGNAQTVAEIKLSSIMPEQLDLSLDLADGCMVWESDETVYAKLYKDNLSSK